jgi:hypothetical protein
MKYLLNSIISFLNSMRDAKQNEYDFEIRNFNLKTKFDMENNTSINHENGNNANVLLSHTFQIFTTYGGKLNRITETN